MKALTILQPHAQLIIEFYKIYETRNWKPYPALIGKRIAIHAGKAKPKEKELSDLLPYFDGRPGVHVIFEAEGGRLPLGAVLGTAVIDSVHRTEDVIEPLTKIKYQPGFYAWELRDIEVFEEPIPAKGFQKIWEWTK